MSRDDPSRAELLDDLRTGAVDADVKRRGVIGGLVASAAAAVGLSGLAGASTVEAREERPEAPLRAKRRARQRFDDATAVRAVLAEHDDALSRLAADGYLDARSAAELTLDPAGDRRAAGHETVTAVETWDGSLTPEIRITRLTDDGSVTLGVRPDTGERWAAFGEAGDTSPVPLDEVTTTSCCKCCGFEQYCCGDWSCGLGDECYCSEWCTRCTAC